MSGVWWTMTKQEKAAKPGNSKPTVFPSGRTNLAESLSTNLLSQETLALSACPRRSTS